MSAHFTTPTDELLLLAETLGEVKTKTEKLEAEFSTQARPLEAATNALSAALSGIKALQFHVLDNNLGQLSARVEEMRKAVDEQVGVIALELKKADETNAAKAGQEAEALRSQIAALQAQLGTLGAQFSAQLERVEFSAKEEAKKLQLIPGPAGAAGASLNPRGTFIDGETYNRLDVVSWLGSSYIAAVDGVTEKPSKNSNQWQVLASRGSGGSGGAGDFGSLAGVAQINQGGTGQTTRAAGLNALLPDQAGATQYMLLTDGAGTVSWGAQPVAGLPSQTSNSGKLLTTDGTNASWSSTLTGSLVVNGTLTAGSTLSTSAGLSCQNADITGGYITLRGYGDQNGGLIFLGQSSNNNYILSNASTIATVIANTGITDVVAAGLRVKATTASTSTSSGALVVGNGTSGGLGVGGAINAGGTITSTNGSGSGLLGMRSSSGNASYVFWSETGVADRGILGFNNGSSTLSYRSFSSSFSTGTEVFSISSAGNTTVAGTLTVSGTGASSFGGRLAIGASALSDRMFYVSGSTGTTGASQFSAVVNPTIPNTVTTGAYGLYLGTNIAAGATVTNGYSLFIAAPDYTGSTVTNKYGLYSNDPNPSYFVGRVLIDNSTASTTTSSGALVVSGGVGVAKNASIGVNNSTGVLRICDNSFGSDYVVLTTAGTDATGTYGLFISQASGTGLNAPTGQMASLRVNNAAIVSANSAGPILQLTGTAPTLTGNSSLTFEFTSNTSLTLKMRGSDGVTRSASITFS